MLVVYNIRRPLLLIICFVRINYTNCQRMLNLLDDSDMDLNSSATDFDDDIAD